MKNENEIQCELHVVQREGFGSQGEGLRVKVSE